MRRNIEIKARVTNADLLKKLASKLSDHTEMLDQIDIFFNVPKGRLKLRTCNAKSVLIFYERSDVAGPKSSSYQLVPAEDPEALGSALSGALGVRGTVRKKRILFLVGQTRVHLDDVEGLGAFVELEVVLRPDQTTEDGTRIAQELMTKLEIEPEHLVQGAYIDLLDLNRAGVK